MFSHGGTRMISDGFNPCRKSGVPPVLGDRIEWGLCPVFVGASKYVTEHPECRLTPEQWRRFQIEIRGTFKVSTHLHNKPIRIVRVAQFTE